ncbi:hypothetical protein J5681_03400 [bacterium]|nr:hypothetical protein [bacterium]
MKISGIFAVFAALFLTVSCGSTDERGNTKPEQSSNRPKWTEVAEKIERDDAVLFVGEASIARSEEDAVHLALQNAFAKVSDSFGVSVRSEFKSHEVEHDGEYTYAIGVKSSVTGKQIEVKDYHIKDKFTECLHSKNGNEYNAFVLVSIPKRELARIKVEVDGFGAWALKSEIPEAADRIRELFPVFNQKGVKLNQELNFDDTGDLSAVASASNKAFFLKIEVKETKSEESDGEFYSLIEIKAELFNLLTAEIVNHWRVESKGAAYSKEEALSNGITKAVQEIAGQI